MAPRMNRLWSRRGRSPDRIILESAPAVTPASRIQVVERKGIDQAVQPGSDAFAARSNQVSRAQFLYDLRDAYLGCVWAGACIDTVARTTTAGGLDLDSRQVAGQQNGGAKTLGASAAPLQRLLDYVNPQEDIRQLMRGIITDLQVYGDAFLEVVWWLGLPVALYSLDCPTMVANSDPHGMVSGYTQVLDAQKMVQFEQHEVIHFSMDNPRGSIYGIGPTEKGMAIITTWLFTEGVLKERMRKGDPPNIHAMADGERVSENDLTRWIGQYMVKNIGIPNIGKPVFTRDIQVGELQTSQLQMLINVLNQHRDATCSNYGTPPQKVGIIESGNLGGGTGTEQNKTFEINTCGPYAEIALEKMNFHLTWEAFGVNDGELNFGDIDWRDDKVIDDIDSQRLRDGRVDLNVARASIGQPPVDGGDDPILVMRQDMMLWQDLPALSHANLAKAQAGAAGGILAPPPAEAFGRAFQLVEAWDEDLRHRRVRAFLELQEAAA